MPSMSSSSGHGPFPDYKPQGVHFGVSDQGFYGVRGWLGFTVFKIGEAAWCNSNGFRELNQSESVVFSELFKSFSGHGFIFFVEIKKSS